MTISDSKHNKILLSNIKHEVVRTLSIVELRRQEEVEELEQKRREVAERQMELNHQNAAGMLGQGPGPGPGPGPGKEAPDAHTPYHRDQPKVGRNQPCPCGSGKKYKHCHGKIG